MSSPTFKYRVAAVLELRALIRKLAAQEQPRCWAATGGFAVLCRHTFRPGWWRVHYLDASQEPVASVDAPTYSEGLYLAHLGGARLDALHEAIPPAMEEAYAQAARA